MTYEKLDRKQDGELTVQFDSRIGMVSFYFAGEKRFKKSIKDCEKQYPQYLWWKILANPYHRYIL